MEPIHGVFESLVEGASNTELQSLAEVLARKDIDLVINLSLRQNCRNKISSFKTYGYQTRRLAVEYSVPLITDMKCAKLIVEVSQCVNQIHRIHVLISALFSSADMS